MSTPEQIQDQIEHTRESLSTDVDRLTEKVAPDKVVGRKVENVRNRAGSLRERIMGSSHVGLQGARDSVSGTVSGVGDAAASVPQAVRQQAQGNPLAAGLIAFGLGWLLSSVVPPSRPEQQLAAQAEGKAKEMAEPLKSTGQDMAAELKEPLQQSVQQVKDTAADAAQQTTEQAKQAAQDVKEPVQR